MSVFLAVGDLGISDEALLLMVATLVGIAGLVILLYAGKSPMQVKVSRYTVNQAYPVSPNERIRFLSSLRSLLEVKDYKGAHRHVCDNLNWFYAQRGRLPEAYETLWFQLRAKVNRMLTLDGWYQEFAKRDKERLRLDALGQINAYLEQCSGARPIESKPETKPETTSKKPPHPALHRTLS